MDTILNNSSTSGEISNGQTIFGTIDTAGDRDAYRIELEAGVTYTISLTGLSLSDPFIRGIHDENFNLISGTSNDDGGEGLNSLVTFTPATSGTFFIVAGAFGSSTGDFALTVESSLDETEVAAVDETGTAFGVINSVDDSDLISVELQAGTTYVIGLNANGFATSPLLDPLIEGILDANQNLIPGTRNDDGGPGLNSLVTFTPETSGTYFIQASAFGLNTGAYSVSVEPETSLIRSDDPVRFVGLSGNNLIDSLILGYAYGADESGGIDISYSFPDADSQFSSTFYGPGSEPFVDFASLSPVARDFFRGTLEQISRFTNANFTEVTETDTEVGTIRTAFTGLGDPGVLGFAFVPVSTSDSALVSDIWIVGQNLAEGDVAFNTTLIHELGHAIGLKHPFETEPGNSNVLSAEFDNLDYTVMSYTSSFRNDGVGDLEPQTFMSLDIQALQYLYGVDTVTTAGNQTYDFDQSERHYLTIWDYAGNDTISVGNASRSVNINLTPGTWSDVGTTINYTSGDTENFTVFIAEDTIIENAVGGAGDDTIRGNDADNELLGAPGDDFIAGGKGNDFSRGGFGNDQLFAGAGDEGNDTLAGGRGDDTLGGGAGDDLVVGGGFVRAGLALDLGDLASDDGQDTLFGGAGNDTLIGGGYSDTNENGSYDVGEEVITGIDVNTLYAGTGNDRVVGAAGNDTLGGGTGDDTLRGGDGNDTFYGGRGDSDDTGRNDVISGGNGNDTVFAGAGNDDIDGGLGNDQLFNGAGDDSVRGNFGDDTIFGGAGDDNLRGGFGADTFAFFDGNGDDVIGDFNIADDTLDLNGTEIDFTDLASVEAAASNATQGGVAGLLIDTGTGDSIFLEGLTTNDLASINIIF
ncbi:M10 family metallopeptidase [Kordiimonas sp. SCSIO 12610]|uniref:M10 family metallopeptidase n=1 Tax=Kordiimonas sp. SCSIO 12610 TaxID=2829597 RepID=UPI00210BE31C|nr:M10 family metallopeptidase C-terminal domain-containing protein [Kordiimonas sp. SCSIO 12610]UTW56228.1 hypothetical protein KFF44_04830 [Kordiimonas sp. SCSIO 12610]